MTIYALGFCSPKSPERMSVIFESDYRKTCLANVLIHFNSIVWGMIMWALIEYTVSAKYVGLLDMSDVCLADFYHAILQWIT